MSKRIAIIGNGVMGTVLYNALHDNNDVTTITRNSFPATDWSEYDTVCFAIKPQDFKLLSPLPLQGKLIISVMAGISTAALITITQSDQIIRCMPNTPTRIGAGMTAWCKTSLVTQACTDWFTNSFAKLTKLLEVADDQGINLATAVSASGPGFWFAQIESYMRAAEQLGFTAAEAKLLVTETFIGCAELLKQPEANAATLKAQVTSKGGTTAAGLDQLTQHDLDGIWQAVLQAAYQRAQELSA